MWVSSQPDPDLCRWPGRQPNEGLNRLVREGQIKQAIGGHWGRVRSLSALALQNKIEVYCPRVIPNRHYCRDFFKHYSQVLLVTRARPIVPSYQDQCDCDHERRRGQDREATWIEEAIFYSVVSTRMVYLLDRWFITRTHLACRVDGQEFRTAS